MRSPLRKLRPLLLAALFGPGLLQADNPEPPREIPLKVVKIEDLPDLEISEHGRIALALDPEKWRLAETPNFMIHYRRVTEAKKVAREVEYDLWFVAEALKASREQYAKKSQVFVFQDEAEWAEFLSKLPGTPSWFASFAYGDELFLNIRRSSGPDRFDSQTLAHECTHAVVARLYPDKRFPLYLSEGFAEYMGSASVARRKNQSIGRHQSELFMASMPLEELLALSAYPESEERVGQLYQTSEKLVRYMYAKYPPASFPQFIDEVLAGTGFQDAVMKVYGAQLKSYEEFASGFEKFES